MKNIALFCGGYSSEYDISVKSAQTIQDNFPAEYNLFKVFVRESGWVAEFEENEYFFDLNTMSFEYEKRTISADAAIVYIHGDPGENGKIQSMLEMKAIPYLNSGPLASALSFDKWYCNQFLKGFGIRVAPSVLLKEHDDRDIESIVEKLGLPVFVKPADSGSSFGISKVKTKEDLLPAIEKAFEEGETVVIEGFLEGTEVTCGVYRRKEGLHALPLTEIVSDNEFFDYEAKYLGKSNEVTPARVEESVRMEVQKLSKEIYKLLSLRSIARIDFMLVNDTPFVIEVNTTPGFSPASIVPQMIHCDGASIHDFWKEIVDVELLNK